MKLVASTAALTIALAASGCSVHSYRELSKDDLQRMTADKLEEQIGERPDAIECPGGLKVEPGESARCTLVDGSTRLGLTATVASVDDDRFYFDITVDEPR